MDVNMSVDSLLDSALPGKQYNFCDDDSSEHGYGSLESLNCSTESPIIPTATAVPLSNQSVDDCSPPKSLLEPLSCPLSISSNESSGLISESGSLISQSSTTGLASSSSSSPLSSPCGSPSPSISSSPVIGKSGNCDNNNNDKKVDGNVIVEAMNNLIGHENKPKKSLNICDGNQVNPSSLKEPKNNSNAGTNICSRIVSPTTQSNSQMLQPGNRFKFIPKNRQNSGGGDRSSGVIRHHIDNNNVNRNRGSRRYSRSESDCPSEGYNNNRKTSSTIKTTKNNEEVVFIIKRVDRSLRRTVSESSGEIQPVRGILKYPQGWNRRTLSESNCDNTSNFLQGGENGRTKSMECISPLETSCEGSSTESSLLTSSGEGVSSGQEEEKPKKSVHFNCYVSAATFNTNSIILDTKNRKRNKRGGDKLNTNKTTNTANSGDKNNNRSKQYHLKPQRQQMPHQQSPHPVKNNKLNNNKGPNNGKNNDSNKSNINAVNSGKSETPEGQDILNTGSIDQTEQSENVDPMLEMNKMRSRQDSGYDSETNVRKSSFDGITCVKSSKRKFTIKKVDLNQ